MRSAEHCPKCRREFDAEEQRARVTPFNLAASIADPFVFRPPGVLLYGVSCPFCGEQFQSRTLRVFGVPYWLYGVLLVALLVALIACSFLFWLPR
jgi:hypothetical protein